MPTDSVTAHISYRPHTIQVLQVARPQDDGIQWLEPDTSVHATSSRRPLPRPGSNACRGPVRVHPEPLLPSSKGSCPAALLSTILLLPCAGSGRLGPACPGPSSLLRRRRLCSCCLLAAAAVPCLTPQSGVPAASRSPILLLLLLWLRPAQCRCCPPRRCSCCLAGGRLLWRAPNRGSRRRRCRLLLLPGLRGSS